MRERAHGDIINAAFGNWPYGLFIDAALHHLLPRLVAEQRAALAALEADFDRVADPEAQEHLGRLLHLKRRHLPELESLTAHPHSVTAVPA